MPASDNVTTLQSFLGLANYYQNFIKNLHDLRAPLNELLKKDKKWRWTPGCLTAFDQIKKALTSDLFLTHYDPKRKKILTALLRSKRLGGGVLWEPYSSYHNGLFLPLLVRQINIGVIRTLRDFLPFLCNSIFLVQYNLLSNIRVCVFISDPFRGHNKNSEIKLVYSA